MMSTKLAGVLVAVLLVATGATAAALPGSAPADADAGQATEHADGSDAADAHAENESAGGDSDAAADESDAAADDSDVGAENDSDASSEAAPGANAPEHAQDRGPNADNRPQADRGPPVEMPDQVPDFVTEIHGLVGDFLSGDVTDDLGAAISDLTPGESQHGDEASSGGPDAGAAPQGAGPA